MGSTVVTRALRSSSVVISCLFLAITAAAQTGPAPQPTPEAEASPSPSLERRFVKNILADQKVIWTSPFSLNHGDARWLIPLAASSGLLFGTDRHSAGELQEPGDHHARIRISSDVSKIGVFYTTAAVAGSFYLVGRTTNNPKALETGLLSAQALIDTMIVTSALKTASQRQRPHVDNASGEFYDGGSSFPSGHAASAWSVATVIAHEYGKRRPLVRFSIYGLAAAVSVARYTEEKHFLSDVLIGSVIGYAVGRYVYNTYHDPAVDDQLTRPRESNLIPFAMPIYDHARQTYGLRLGWQF
ncbi:MAG TPA: phosphatase PAP2 family protein [Pyrinomonadaceae bacterium]